MYFQTPIPLIRIKPSPLGTRIINIMKLSCNKRHDTKKFLKFQIFFQDLIDKRGIEVEYPNPSITSPLKICTCQDLIKNHTSMYSSPCIYLIMYLSHDPIHLKIYLSLLIHLLINDIPCIPSINDALPYQGLTSSYPPLHEYIPSIQSNYSTPCQDQIITSHDSIPSTPLYDSILFQDLIIPFTPLDNLLQIQDQSTHSSPCPNLNPSQYPIIHPNPPHDPSPPQEPITPIQSIHEPYKHELTYFF